MVTLVLALALAAQAAPETAPPPHADPRVLEARKACAAGRVDEGVEILAAIIAESGDLNALYNQARCFQLNGRTEPAIARFREYLRLASDIPPAEHQRVEGFINELQADLDARVRREEVARALAVQATSAPPARDPASTRHLLRITGLSLAAGGVAALLTGAYFSWRMGQVSDDLESEWSLTAARFKQRWDEGKRDELLARVGVSVGVVALAGSATCFLLSRRVGTAVEERRVAVAPLPLPGGGGGVLRVRF
jgi:tetratricopeptide (TPR) repeat protein